MLLIECCSQIVQASEAMKKAEEVAGNAHDRERSLSIRMQAENMARRILPYLGSGDHYEIIRKTDPRAAEIFLSFSLLQDWEQVKQCCGEDAESYLKEFDSRMGEILN